MDQMLAQSVSRDNFTRLLRQTNEHVHDPRLEMQLLVLPHDPALPWLDETIADAEAHLQFLKLQRHAKGSFLSSCRDARCD
jgi:hypothetical protein